MDLPSAILIVLTLTTLLLSLTLAETNTVDPIASILKDLEKQVDDLDTAEFVGDTKLVQHLDKVNHVTTYKLENSGETVFERQSYDRDEEAIVLHPSEDQIFGRHEKIYIGLRRVAERKQSSGRAKYYVIQIYLRKPGPIELNLAISIGGQPSIVEFDRWVNRRDTEELRKHASGWTSTECSSSIFFPCPDSPPPEESPRNPQIQSEPTKKFVPKLGPGILVKDEIVAEPPYNAKAIVEFFWDFEQDLQQGRLVTKVLGWAASGIANGIKEDVKDKVGGLWNSLTGQTTTPKPGIIGSLLNMLPGGAKTTTTSKPGIFAGIKSLFGGATTTTTTTAKPGILDGLKGIFGGSKTTAKPAVKGRSFHQNTQTSLGWKTLGNYEHGTLSQETEPFVGFGTCEFDGVTKDELENVKSADKLVGLMAFPLKTQCSLKQMQYYYEPLHAHILKMKPDRTFTIDNSSDIMKAEKLTIAGVKELSRALEMTAFSKAFKVELFTDKPAIAPNDSEISRRVHVFVDTILRALDQTYTKLQMHRIKLLRNLARTVKTAFVRLLRDYNVLKSCDSCYLDLKVTHADMIRVMTLLNFIMHGLGPVYQQKSTVYEAFERFGEANAGYIFEKVQGYIRVSRFR